MANMKIYCEDPTLKGIQLDESHYITYAHHADFDLGTADFSLGFIFKCDSTVGNKTVGKVILHKGPYSLNSDTGYDVAYFADNEKLILTINDGDVTASQASTANASFADDTWHYVWINVDRNVGTTFYKDGVAISTSSDNTTGAQNTLNAAEDLVIGGFTGQTAYLKGYLSGIHLCPGFLPSADWVLRWYYRMKYIYPRLPVYENATVWPFTNTLDALTYDAYESTTTQTGTYSAGDPTFSAYYPSVIDYTLTDNYGLNFERGFIQLDTIQRSIDGTAKYYETGTKQRCLFSFTSNSIEQRYFIEGIWVARATLNLYLDANSQMEFRGFIIEPPNIIEIVPNVWQYQIELEEI